MTIERTETARDHWDQLYTIEFNGSKGWEVVKTFPKTDGVHKVTSEFLKMVVNTDGQYRLTIPK